MPASRLIRGILVLVSVLSMSFVIPRRPELQPVPSIPLEVRLERIVLADLFARPEVIGDAAQYGAYVIDADDEATNAALTKWLERHTPPVGNLKTIAVSQPGDIAVDASTGRRVLIFHVLTHRVDEDLADVLAVCNCGNYVHAACTYEMRRTGGRWAINRVVRGAIRRHEGAVP